MLERAPLGAGRSALFAQGLPSHAEDMTATAGPSAATPEARTPTGRRRRVAVGVAAAAVVLIGGFFFGRALWWSLRPAPSFPALVDNPDPSLHGTVAYLQPYPNDDCIYVAAASGAASKRLSCFGSAGGGELVWLSDGRLEITHYGDAQHPDDVWRKIVDVETGAIEDVPRDEIPAWSEPPATAPGPNGEIITSTSSRGTLTVTLTTDDDTRSLLSVGAPNTYTFGSPAWGPEGDWFVVKDDLDRLLVVTTGDPSQTRVLVEGGWGQAVTGAEVLSDSG